MLFFILGKGDRKEGCLGLGVESTFRMLKSKG